MDGLFWMVTCHVGAEPVVRKGLPAANPGARPAFARPGVLTFKADAPVAPDAPRPHPLARTWSIGLGSAADAAAVLKAAASLPERLVLHVAAGEAGPPGHTAPVVLGKWAAEAARVEALLRESGRFATEVAARVGEAVLDVVVRPDEPWVLGWHRHGPGRGSLPGGRWPLAVPADAPSRAWSKVEELIAWSGAPIARGDRVLEIGSAPGGATLALLDRGCRVIGVDPQPMALPSRVAGRSFTHIKRAIEAVPRDDLPEAVEWIVLDASEAAPAALRSLQELVPRYRKGLRGALITLKLNEWDLVDGLPGWLDQVRSLGLVRADAACLPAFRQELGLVGLVS